MSVISNSTKRKAGFKAAKVAVKHPRWVVTGTKVAWPVGKVALKASTPLLKRQARRAAPRVAAVAVVGAGATVGAVYLLKPGNGSEHRQQVAQLMS